MKAENEIDKLLAEYDRHKTEKIHDDIRPRPDTKRQRSLPRWGKFLIITLVLTVVLSVIFYIITPSEAFTYYMAEGLKGTVSVVLYFVKIFGIAVIAILIVLGIKPVLPVVEYSVKHMDKSERHYWRPRSYDVYDDLVEIETWHHDILKFNVGNMKKIGNHVYLISEVIKSRQKDDSLLLESENLEVYRSVVDKKKIEFLSEKLAEAYTMSRNIGFQRASAEVARSLKSFEEA